MIDFLRARFGLSAIPRTVFVLGFVSMLMDISSEMIHSLLPLYLTGTLGASVAMLGLMEGVSEATVAFAKVLSGVISDRIGRRRGLVVAGYAMAAFSKPVFALANSVGFIMGARFVDRFGKGIRGAPRDALIADITPRAHQGAAFGLRQSLDTIGAVLGPLVAIVVMLATDANFIVVFAIAIVPAAASALLAFVGVVDAEGPVVREPKRRVAITFARIRALGSDYAAVVLVGVLVTLARFSEAFLILRSSDAGVPVWLAPIVLVVMNVVYTSSSLPAGRIGDRIGRLSVLALGCAVLVLSEIVLVFATAPLPLAIGIALWGLHMGLSQGLIAAYVAATAPADLRGTAFGIFHLATGVAVLMASLGAGLLWDAYGAEMTFAVGAVFAVSALFALPLLRGIKP